MLLEPWGRNVLLKAANLALVTKLRHELHQHPELSNQERWTKQHLISFLREHTKLEIVERDRWFYAVYRAGVDKPNISFRADMDAIPIQGTIPTCTLITMIFVMKSSPRL